MQMDEVELIKPDEVEMLGELWAANEINQLRVEIADLKSERSRPGDGSDARVQWWLASLDRYGNPSLSDGPHPDRTGVEKAMYLFEKLNLGKGERYAAARVEIFDVVPAAHGANEDAIRTINVAQAGR